MAKETDQNAHSELNSGDVFEKLLDEQSDEEFGLPEFSEHLSESLDPVVLKDWTAQDFASIYVRFRPHLERHAKRFLVNPSQVEEVVQDAFLYLMTTLPELDSEIGVLKFLKWKTRLLALDVIRANSRVALSPIDGEREFQADLPESSQDLERADDAAIVSLALAKLQPRHREALIATLYEEKSAAVVSAQMGMTENAFRQLLFRSRAAFKKALVGEAETAGLSMSAVLSIAARKAAAESGKYISAAGAFLLVMAVSIGLLPQLTNQPAELAASTEVQIPEQPIAAEVPATQEQEVPPSEAEVLSSAASERADPTAPLVDESSTEVDAQAASQPESPPAPSSEEPPASPAPQTQIVSEADLILQQALGASALAQLASVGPAAAVSSMASGEKTVVISSANGLTGFIDFDLESVEGISGARFQMRIGDDEFISVPNVTYSEMRVDSAGNQILDYVATDLVIGDSSGNYGFLASSNTEVSRSALRVTLVFDSQGNLTTSDMRITPRT